MSIQETILDRLRGAGIDAYLSGQKDGVCKRPYAVVSDGGTYALGKTTGAKSLIVTAYVPAGRPLELRGVIAGILAALAPYKAIRTTGEISPEDVDDLRKAHIASIEYTALCAR